MATTAPALEKAQYLKEELASRTGLAAVLSFDSDKNPLIKLGTGVAGAKGCLVKVKPVDWSLAEDIIGHSQAVYHPHEILVVFEGVKADGTEPTPMAEKALVLMALAQQGCRVVVYESANGTPPAVAEFKADNYKTTFEDQKWPMIKSM